MWVLSERPILGVFAFFRKNSLQIAAVLAAFLCTVLFSNAAFAVSAEWENGSITYDDRTFSGPQTAPEDSPLGLPEGTQYFEHRDGNNVSVVYFPEGADPSDASGARYATFTQNGDNYTPSGSEQSIAVTPQSEGEGSEDGEVTSCAVNGIGYILCPIMGFIADGMDRIYDFLQNFLEVRPLSTETDSSLFQAWRYMQSFANIAFVLVFLVVVYSQITSQGISNYNVKRMIPRMVIAALFVNTSYYICALLVDASNIIGASLQEIMMQIREELIQGQEQNAIDSLTWSDLTAYLLSGGTIVAAGVVGLSGGGGGGLVYLLVPILITALFAIFVAVAILAARQALITILIVIAPLAFVAFVLPGTQKYFDRWRSIFQTMLLLYPIFSLLFGGAQLAAYLIAQNASSNEVILLAMFVSIAPLIITPFLIRFSGGMLGKLAGMINNPARGPLDKVKNWSQDKYGHHKARRMAEERPFSGLARRMQSRKEFDEGMRKAYDTKRRRNFNASALGRRVAVAQMHADDSLKESDAANEQAYAEKRLTNPAWANEAVEQHAAQKHRDAAKKNVEVFLDEMGTKDGAAMHAASDPALRAASTSLRSAMQREHVLGSRAAMAASLQRSDYAKEVLDSKALARAAGGLKGETGASLALANATATIRKDFGEGQAAQMELLTHFGQGLDNNAMKRLAMGGTAEGMDSNGEKYTFDASQIGGELHDAAVSKFIKSASASDFEKLIMHTSDEQAKARAAGKESAWVSLNSTFLEGAKQFSGALPHMGSKTLDFASQGLITSDEHTSTPGQGITGVTLTTIKDGKLGPEKLAKAHTSSLERYTDLIQKYYAHDASVMKHLKDADARKEFSNMANKLMDSASDALKDDQLQGVITASVRQRLEELRDATKIKT